MATTFWQEHIETMPRDQLRALQEARLRDILPKVYETSPLIRQLWDASHLTPHEIGSIAAFVERAPFMNKDTIRRFRDENADPCGGFVALSDPRLKGVFSTSGTTGDPTPLPRALRTPFEDVYHRDYWQIGLRPGDYTLSLGFTFRTGHGYSGIREFGATTILLNHTPDHIPRFIEASLKFRPRMFSLLSSPMLIAMEVYFERNTIDPVDIFSSYAGAVYGGEALGARHRALVNAWGLEVFETASVGDVCGATECRAHTGFHAFEDFALVECLQPDGDRAVADGEIGEMVVTTLFDPLVPLIRYRTDDLVTMHRDRCACGRTHARFHLRGRKGDQILVQGVAILPLNIRDIVDRHAETRAGLFQIIRPQIQMDALRLRIGHDPATVRDGGAGLRSRLTEELEAALGVPVRLELVGDADLLKLGPPHKIPRVTKQ
jgi:phenylacetate-CoA ligase